MSQPTYVHIFTDGLDKLLSASIWFKDWGDNNAFLFYSEGKLKGYVSVEGIKLLSEIGLRQLHDPHFLTSMFQQVKDITNQASYLHKTITQLSKSMSDRQKIFLELVELLRKGYALYFSTEEYMTEHLDQEKDQNLIAKIGRFRLRFIETNIQITEDLYKVAGLFAQQLGIATGEELFLTWKEIANLSQQHVLQEFTLKRKKAFLIEKKNDDILCIDGEEAIKKFNDFVNVPNMQQKELRGRGASAGKVTGLVYKVSVADNNLEEGLEKMREGDILVIESTQPRFTPFCKKAKAIVTDEGGVLSHAAILAREFGIPCVVGTRTATSVLQTGQTITVDGELGVVTMTSGF